MLCSCSKGKPKPRVQWYSANGKIASLAGTEDFREKSFDDDNDGEGVTSKRLVIDQLNRSHANGTFVCLAEIDEKVNESNLRKSVRINMYRKYTILWRKKNRILTFYVFRYSVLFSYVKTWSRVCSKTKFR